MLCLKLVLVSSVTLDAHSHLFPKLIMLYELINEAFDSYDIPILQK